MKKPPMVDASAQESLDAASPEIVAEKRVWAAPSFQEFDYTLTQATLIPSGADGGIYS